MRSLVGVSPEGWLPIGWVASDEIIKFEVNIGYGMGPLMITVMPSGDFHYIPTYGEGSEGGALPFAFDW